MKTVQAIGGLLLAAFLFSSTRGDASLAYSLIKLLGVRNLVEAQLMFLVLGVVFAVAVAGGGGALWELLHPSAVGKPAPRRKASHEEQRMDPERLLRLNVSISPAPRPIKGRTCCPDCGSPTVLRTVRSGARKGQTFHGCSTYPKCRRVYRDESALLLRP